MSVSPHCRLCVAEEFVVTDCTHVSGYGNVTHKIEYGSQVLHDIVTHT